MEIGRLVVFGREREKWLVWVFYCRNINDGFEQFVGLVIGSFVRNSQCSNDR